MPSSPLEREVPCSHHTGYSLKNETASIPDRSSPLRTTHFTVSSWYTVATSATADHPGYSIGIQRTAIFVVKGKKHEFDKNLRHRFGVYFRRKRRFIW
jgi:hypothetical protein